ncbi:MAG: PilT/PilU family type 4a pilus ATPase [Dehalococcoidia bacterium]|nr:PilT/PilU family type 4a pilus ATPase [Dehalococcoidia bacterium]
MKCPHCQAENRKGAEFCGTCGQPLRRELVCPGCGHTNPPGNSFCDKCGHALVEQAPPNQSPESKSESAYIKVEKLLKLMVDKHASDLHLKVSSPPVLRIDGVLVPQDDLPPLTAPDIESAFKQVTTDDQKIAFARERCLDIACSVSGLARFRLNILQQRGTLCLAFRLVPFKIPSIEELELPQICKELVMKPRGLILVTGPSGSGKSTTLAAMISHLNENEKRNVITIEDPIEFLYPDKKCLIAQLELGNDTKSFAAALPHTLRHDPNVIVIGEMRDLDTISTAITAAETGHLILGTLHTIDAVQSVARLVDMFPNGQQQQIRLQLSQVIEAVLSQRLVTRSEGGQIAAVEIMIANNVIRRLIREDEAFEIPANIEMSIKEGMQTLDQALADLVRRNTVTIEEAMMKSSNPRRLSELLHHCEESRVR